MSYLYQASLVPIGKPVTMPVERGQPFTHTYTDATFDCQRTAAHNVKVCVAHDRDLEVGKLELLLTHAGWWRCTFKVDADVGDELKVGQPVSVGLAVMPSGDPILKEVSLVRSGHVAGAQITHRETVKPKPITPRRTPAPTATAPVIYRSARPATRISLDDELVEYERRQAWYGDNVPPEVIIEHMRTELAAFRRRQ